ncbi:hypothetical protein GLOTRDRAFT_114006 [Gloeophyllum trabeum ATCC 11539]|uniref:Mediator of RNA polymerase II transcription subunit 20 n=1 Tax=Gloeophyllum trabeum (strain ATCC 11539 / FP-39264 / Madison 617) TaxID=670483 RepID=S7QHJ5_GLOTA|nr:uncharacterized protein GLOTRDRAFT_114006 [Gloeophyllum trabeum ATCC 11539]EPQ59266.1 hypothetical protein GLOTRDRAFT_114006 [Gloeophyllum trabeum ATCC 11539]
MGFSGLARWTNAPSTGLDLVTENIQHNYAGVVIGKWQLSIRSYRSTLGTIPGFQIPAERSMAALTMDNNVFVVLEDPMAPTRADFLQHVATLDPSQPVPDPSHYRSTFLTLRPPGALEQLLAQLKAKWVSSRQSAPDTSQRGSSSGSQVRIEGRIFSIGSDWIVRAGTVLLGGGTNSTKGMLLEAEYRPLPVLHSQTADSASELLSNLLTAILPNVRDAKIVAVTISDSQWEEVLWDREQEEDNIEDKQEEIVDDIFVSGDQDLPVQRKGDWIGLERDRRSAFLIIGALRSEGIF